MLTVNDHTDVDDIGPWGCAVLVGGSNGDGAWHGLVTIAEVIDPRPCIFQPPVYGRLIYSVTYMSDRRLTQA